MVHLLKDTFREWREDGANRLAAALAYYTTFSIAPLLVLIIAVAGLVGGREAAQTQTMAQVEDLLGAEGRDFVQGMIESASRPATGLTATMIGAVTLLFAMIFKFLPEIKIPWKDVWLGAAVTSALFSLGKFLIGLYLGRSEVGSTFGAAGSLVILLIWVYYSAQILFFGAEFTQVYANRYGSKIVPDAGMVRITERERAEKGIPHKKKLENVSR